MVDIIEGETDGLNQDKNIFYDDGNIDIIENEETPSQDPISEINSHEITISEDDKKIQDSKMFEYVQSDFLLPILLDNQLRTTLQLASPTYFHLLNDLSLEKEITSLNSDYLLKHTKLGTYPYYDFQPAELDSQSYSFSNLEYKIPSYLQNNSNFSQSTLSFANQLMNTSSDSSLTYNQKLSALYSDEYISLTSSMRSFAKMVSKSLYDSKLKEDFSDISNSDAYSNPTTESDNTDESNNENDEELSDELNESEVITDYAEPNLPNGITLDNLYGMSAPTIGINLSRIADWSTERPFLNELKSARPWALSNLERQYVGNGEEILTELGLLDEHGYPREIPPGYSSIQAGILTSNSSEESFLTGRYVVRYEGEGNINITANSSVNIISKSPGKVIFDFTSGVQSSLFISITSTDPNNTGNYIRNISVIKEEYVDLYDAGQIFKPEFLDVIKDMREVRFMDWVGTNASTIIDTNDVKNEHSYTWFNNAPISVQVELANQIGAEPWFNIPFHASDDLIRETAVFIRDNLDPNLKAHIEYSNEVWNFAFQQAKDSQAAGLEKWGDQYGPWPFSNYYGYAAAKVMDIFTDVFEGQENRLDGIIAWTQHGTYSLQNHVLPGVEEYLAETGSSKTVHDLFGSIATAPYFGYGFTTEVGYNQIKAWLAEGGETFTIDKIFNQLFNNTNSSWSGTSIEEVVVTAANMSSFVQSQGLNFTTYELGSHIGNGPYVNDSEFVNILHLVHEDVRMIEAYNQLYDGLESVGVQLFNAFNGVQAPAKTGDWGHMEYLGDTDDVRWQVLMDINSTPQESQISPDGVYQQGITRFGTTQDDDLFGSLKEDFLIGGDGSDRLYGGNGDDGLHGGKGNDVLVGGAGDDRLVGGSGDDDLYGGNGEDIYVLNHPGEGIDEIYGFEFGAGGDKLDLYGILSNYDSLDNLIADFINVTSSSENKLEIQVDRAGERNFITVAIINSNEEHLSLEEMIEYDNIIF